MEDKCPESTFLGSRSGRCLSAPQSRRRTHRDGAASSPPLGVISPVNLHRSEAAVVVTVYNPYRMRSGHFLIHDNLLYIAVPVRIRTKTISDIGLSPITRVKSNYRPFFPVPVPIIRPIYLHVGLFQSIQILFRRKHTSVRRFCASGQLLGYQLLERPWIAPGRHWLAHSLISHTGPRYRKQVPHHVFFIVSIAVRWRYGVMDFRHLVRFYRKGRQQFRHVLQRNDSSFRVIDFPCMVYMFTTDRDWQDSQSQK